jgi:hypothetical protein
MAIEIEAQRYLFEPNTIDVPDRPFYYNSLHDLESIWWITNFFLFHLFTEADQPLIKTLTPFSLQVPTPQGALIPSKPRGCTLICFHTFLILFKNMGER